MKYAIEGFSQAKLLEYNLDILDAFLLRWFADFIASGSMRQTIQKGRIYYWIHYPTVMKELPAMGIHNTKSIAIKFEKYVSAGILDKTVIRTQKGATVYYAIIESVFRSLLYTPENPHWNKNSCAENPFVDLPFYDEKTPENDENSNKKGEDAGKNEGNSGKPSEENPHRNKNSCAENLFVDLPFYDEKPAENDENSSKNGENSGENEENLGELSEENPHRNKSSCAHENKNSCAHRNENSCALNDSTTKDSPTTATTSVSGSEKAAVISHLKKEFGQYLNPELFSADFWPPFSAAIQTLPNRTWSEYIAFLFRYTAEKKPQSPVNYIYRIASKPFMLAAYFEDKAKTEAAKQRMTKKRICVICGREYEGEECPACHFCYYDNSDAKKVALAKRIYELPDSEKAKLEKELSECSLKYGLEHFAEYQKHKELIYEKYGIHA
ncbi:hypothetical protein [Treponema socranskii]|uniref:hypothetical protein n=1 Tax=Treponema socranskii TaxID=53419 RepID=UPI003D8EBE44